MKAYSAEVLDLFNDPKHIYNANDKCAFIGTASDIRIGEYVNLYLDVEFDPVDMSHSKIKSAKFSAMGSVMLIAAGEHFCRCLRDITIADALTYCDPESGILYRLGNVGGREHSVNFVAQSFYSAVEAISGHNANRA